MYKVVFDTNALVSALLRPTATPRQALDTVLSNGIVIVSEPTLDELNEVISRPKFDRYVRGPEKREFLALLTPATKRIRIMERIIACRDPRDDKFLEVAVNGGASCIVTGDDDLLALHPFRGIDILTPRDFLAHVQRMVQGEDE